MKSFKDYIEERNTKIDRSVQDFHVNVPGHGMVLVKARSEGEAQAKAKAKFDKGDDHNDTFKEAYRKPTEAEIKKDKERENAGKKRPSMDHKSASKKMYGNMMGGLKEEEQIDEILDTPKAMTSYKNKAKASYDKAASSAAAKILRGRDKDGNRADHRPELKTMAKRKKGMTAADMVAVRRTFDNLRKEDLDESDIAEILRQYALSENVNADQLADLTEEEINEIIGKAIGGAFKIGAKTAVGAGRVAAGAGRLAGKGVKKALFTKQGSLRGTQNAKMDREGDRAEKEARKAEAERARRDRIKNAEARKKKADGDLKPVAKPKKPAPVKKPKTTL